MRILATVVPDYSTSDAHAWPPLQPGRMLVDRIACLCGRHLTWCCECGAVTYGPTFAYGCSLLDGPIALLVDVDSAFPRRADTVPKSTAANNAPTPRYSHPSGAWDSSGR